MEGEKDTKMKEGKKKDIYRKGRQREGRGREEKIVTKKNEGKEEGKRKR